MSRDNEIARVFEIDERVLLSRSHSGFRKFGEIEGYDVYVLGQPLLFGAMGPTTAVSDFLLTFSGLNAVCMLLPKDSECTEIILACDLYGLTEFYYVERKAALAFSLSMEALVSPDAAIDEISLFELYYKGFVYGQNTPFHGVKKNCPLTFLRITFRDEKVSASLEDLFPVGEPTTNAVFGAALESAVKQLPGGDTIALSYSGGVDSDALFEALVRTGRDVAPVHYYYKDEELRKAYAGARRRRKRLTVFRPKGNRQTLKLRWQACAVHYHPDMRLDISRWARESGHETLMTGQNADTLFQFGNTAPVKWRSLVRSLVLFGLTSREALKIVTRLIVSAYPRVPTRFLEAYQRRCVGLISQPFESACLTAKLNHNDSIPWHRDLEHLSFLPAALFVRWCERTREVVTNLAAQRNLSWRQKLHVAVARGFLTAGDVRVFTSAAAMFGLNNVQLYSSPPMYRYFFNRVASRRDIVTPKGTSRRYARYGSAARESVAAILGDSVNVSEVAGFGSLGEPSDETAQVQLAYLTARYPWISASSLYTLRRSFDGVGTMWVAHLYHLVRREFETSNVAEEANLFEGALDWESSRAG